MTMTKMMEMYGISYEANWYSTDGGIFREMRAYWPEMMFMMTHWENYADESDEWDFNENDAI